MFLSRKSNRLFGYDYSTNNYYFITINAFGCSLGDVTSEGKIKINMFGEIVYNSWKTIFRKYEYLEEDEFKVMPDHFHGILIISSETEQPNPSLSSIVGSFKSNSSRKIHNAGAEAFRWHRSYNDRIIRNEKELYNIRNYIRNNTLKPRELYF